MQLFTTTQENRGEVEADLLVFISLSSSDIPSHNYELHIFILAEGILASHCNIFIYVGILINALSFACFLSITFVPHPYFKEYIRLQCMFLHLIITTTLEGDLTERDLREGLGSVVVVHLLCMGKF